MKNSLIFPLCVCLLIQFSLEYGWKTTIDLPSPTQDHIEDLSFSPDNRYLACAASYHTYIYDTLTWKIIHTENGDRNKIASAVRFSPDGTKLAIGHYYNENITILSTSNWAKLAEYPSGHQYTVNIDWSADSSLIMDCGSDHVVTVRHVGDYDKIDLKFTFHFKDTWICKFTTDKKILIGTEFGYEVYSPNTNSTPLVNMSLNHDAQCLDSNRDGSKLVVGTVGGKGYIAPTNDNHTTVKVNTVGVVYGCAYSKDNDYYVFAHKGEILVFNATTDQEVESVETPKADHNNLDMSYDGKYIATAMFYSKILIWDKSLDKKNLKTEINWE